jgi:hypothetical protein
MIPTQTRDPDVGNRAKMGKSHSEQFSTAVPQKAEPVLRRGERLLRADFVEKGLYGAEIRS